MVEFHARGLAPAQASQLLNVKSNENSKSAGLELPRS